MRWGALQRGFLLIACVAAASVPARAQEGGAVPWQSFEAARAASAQRGRPLLVYVRAPWCGWCYRLEEAVFPAVQPYLAEHFELARLDVGDDAAQYRLGPRVLSAAELARHLGAATTPALVFLDAGGQPVLRLPSYVEADVLRPVLAYVASGAYRRQSYEAYLLAGR
jgi:thioredoxin-related protein